MTSAVLAVLMAARLIAFQAAVPANPPPAAETIADVRVHGNQLATDADVIRLSALVVGAPFTSTTVAETTARLRASKQFDEIQVLKRFASIDDSSRIVVMIIVNEGPMRIKTTKGPNAIVRVVRRRGLGNLMFAPIVDGEDGYGLTYGARLALTGAAGGRSRLSFPLTLGGTKQAGAEVERNFSRGPLTRVEIGGNAQTRRNPAFDEDDTRERTWVRAERSLGFLRLGAGGGWQHVSFAGASDRIRSVAADATFDTRADPVSPRNAVYLKAGWERLMFSSASPDTNRTTLDARGYLGLIRQTVLVGRIARDAADEPLPPYLQPLLGGWSSLRGFHAGAYVGDTRVTESIELRVPLSSVVSVAKVGVSVFVDRGASYDQGEALRDQTLHTGVGGSVWFTAAAFRLGLAVAHGYGATTRVNFGAGLFF